MELNSDLLSVDIEEFASKEELENYAIELKGWAYNLNIEHTSLLAKNRVDSDRFNHLKKVVSDIENLTSISRSVEFFNLYRDNILLKGTKEEKRVILDVEDVIVKRFSSALNFITDEIKKLKDEEFKLDVVEFEEFKLNLKTRVVSNQDHAKRLTKAEFTILEALCQSPNRFVNISGLVSHPPSVISRLKKKIHYMECIHTEKGVGTKIIVNKKEDSFL